mmetsp:Transcript_10153/g.25436  ORF Transcript_10153/g.25436 Transcript_10153/m.25436 type:complete len:258 (+) Transcript_10153:1328-2101(+)
MIHQMHGLLAQRRDGDLLGQGVVGDLTTQCSHSTHERLDLGAEIQVFVEPVVEGTRAVQALSVVHQVEHTSTRQTAVRFALSLGVTAVFCRLSIQRSGDGRGRRRSRRRRSGRGHRTRGANRVLQSRATAVARLGLALVERISILTLLVVHSVVAGEHGGRVRARLTTVGALSSGELCGDGLEVGDDGVTALCLRLVRDLGERIARGVERVQAAQVDQLGGEVLEHVPREIQVLEVQEHADGDGHLADLVVAHVQHL